MKLFCYLKFSSKWNQNNAAIRIIFWELSDALVLRDLKGIFYTFDPGTLSSLIERFYGRPGESTLGKPANQGGKYYNQTRFAVRYNATRYFVNKEAAEEFYRNIRENASLLKRNEVSNELTVYKTK